MKQKSFFSSLAIAAVVLAVLSVVSVVLISRANPPQLVANLQPQSAQFLPKRSPLVVSFLFNPEQLQLAAKLATKVDERRQFDREIASLKTQLQNLWGISYDKDLKAWLGSEVTLAVTTTDIDHNPENGLQTGYLLVLAAAKPQLAQTHLDQFWQAQTQKGADLDFSQSHGVAITSNQQAIATAKVGKYVLFANAPSVIRTAINNLQSPGLSLSQNPDYQASLKQLQTPGFAIAFFNPAEVLGSSNTSPTTLTIGFQQNQLGIKAQTILATSAAVPQTASPANDIEILNFLSPGDSLIVGNNLSQTLTNLIPNTSNPILASFIPNILAPFQFQLPTTDLDWITNHYAIALRADSSTWLLAAEVQNPEIELAKLDTKARQQKLTVGEIVSDNQPFTLWTKLEAINADRTITSKIILAHTTIGKHVLLANAVSTLQNALSQPSILDTDPTFKAIATTLGSTNGLVYLNAQDVQRLINQDQSFPLLKRMQNLAIGDPKIQKTDDQTFITGQMILSWNKSSKSQVLGKS